MERNHLGAIQFPLEIDKYIEKEINEGSTIGPLKAPFPDYTSFSPLNSVEKSDGGRRVILDLSFPGGQVCQFIIIL